MKIAIFIPTYNEEVFIEKFLDSLIMQDIFNLSYEVTIRFYDGESTDQTVSLINHHLKCHGLSYSIHQNRKRFVAHAFNDFLKVVEADFLIRLDAHQVYPENYLSRLVEVAKEKKCFGCLGPRIRMAPADGRLISKSIALVLNSRVGVGNSAFRTIGKFSGTREVDTVPFGIWQVSTLKEIGGMDLSLVRNQDDDLNRRLKRHGRKVELIGDLEVMVYPRKSIRAHFKMFYQYGMYKPISKGGFIKILFSRQIMPSLFLFFMAINFLLLGWMAVLLFLSMYLILSFNVLIPKNEKKKRLFFLNGFVLFITHLAYGLGVFRGFILLMQTHK